MSKLIRFILIVSSLLFLNTSISFAQKYSHYSERILSFHTDIVVDTISKIIVTENIKVKANQTDIQRGIYRSLPNKRNIQEKSFYVKYKVTSVKKDGREEPYKTVYENGNYVIYIGDEDIFLNSGIYEYELTYETFRQIGFFEDFDELYWNVNGNYWNFPADQVSATIHLPKGARIIQSACYTGYYKSDSHNCESKNLSSNSIQWSAKDLGVQEGLTIAIGFEKGLIQEPKLPAYLQTQNLIKLLFGFSAVLLAFLAILWMRFGIDPRKPTVIPEFEPPLNLSPAAIGYIKNGKYSHNHLTATIVNLAVKGFVKISEKSESKLFGLTKSTTYKVTKIKDAKGNLTTEERELLNDMRDSMTIDGTYDSSIASMVTTFQSRMKAKKKELINKGNNRNKIIIPFLLISIVYWFIIISSYINLFNINKLIIGIILYGVSFIIYVSIFSIPTLRYKSILFWFWPLFPLGAIFIYWKYIDNQIEPFNLAYVFLVVSLVILTFFKFLIEKPGKEYLEKRSKIQGFQMYLSAAENQQLKFHNSPKMTPEIFEKMLPFAIALSVDDIWGEKFDKFLKINNQEYKNEWYTGGMHGFTSSINNSFSDGFSRSISSSTIAPSDSSSGSGGGGFSGGGGGGGGGGGW